MPANALRELLQHKIEDRLPERALEVALVAEKSARDYFDRLADLIGGGVQ